MPHRLESLARAVRVPRSYFHGRTHVNGCIPNNVLLFRRTTSTDLRRATFELRPHHRFVLIFNLGTTGVVRIGQAKMDLRPGEGILILPYQFHAFLETQREKILWLIVTFELDNQVQLEQFRGKSFRFGAVIRRRLVSLLEIYREEEKESDNQALAFELACLLAQLRPLVSTSVTLPVAADWRSRQFLEDIDLYLRRSSPPIMNIQDLASYLHISESRLRARFRAAFGLSLGAYLRNHRLHLAIEQMRNTRRNLMEIANELGFPDSSAFTRFIRRQTGYTPSEFRRQLID